METQELRGQVWVLSSQGYRGAMMGMPPSALLRQQLLQPVCST